ncbi:MAG: hypothetical protein WCF85_16305 [Rhodospirillaceae bacterium]
MVDSNITTEISFEDIRPDPKGKYLSFQKMVCELAAVDQEYKGRGQFYNFGPGNDGGVEALWRLNDGTAIGYQAKYVLKSIQIDKGDIQQSFKNALNNHPALAVYIVALPCNLTPPIGAEGAESLRFPSGRGGLRSGRITLRTLDGQ